MQQSTVFQDLINSTMREIGYTNIALGYLPLEAAGKKINEEETLLNCFNGS